MDLEHRMEKSILISEVCDIVYHHAVEHFNVFIKYVINQVYQEKNYRRILWVLIFKNNVNDIFFIHCSDQYGILFDYWGEGGSGSNNKRRHTSDTAFLMNVVSLAFQYKTGLLLITTHGVCRVWLTMNIMHLSLFINHTYLSKRVAFPRPPDDTFLWWQALLEFCQLAEKAKKNLLRPAGCFKMKLENVKACNCFVS